VSTIAIKHFLSHYCIRKYLQFHRERLLGGVDGDP